MNEGIKEERNNKIPASMSKKHNPKVSEPQSVKTSMQGLVKRNKYQITAELQLKKKKRKEMRNSTPS